MEYLRQNDRYESSRTGKTSLEEMNINKILFVHKYNHRINQTSGDSGN